MLTTLLPALTLGLYLWLSPADPLPAVEDLDGFPSEHECDEALHFLRARRDWLQGEVDLHGGDAWWGAQYEPAILDNCYRLDVWELLEGAQGSGRRWRDRAYTIELRRRNRDSARTLLAELRRAIGPRAYECRAMPPLIDPAFCRR